MKFLLFIWALSLIAGVTTFTSRPLRKTINGFLSESKMTMPFFATVSWSAHVYGPDRPCWRLAGAQGGKFWEPMSEAIWIPEYIRVDERRPDSRIDVLMASAALPFGVVEPIFLDGQKYVDGGLADNEPIAPLLQFGFDEIWLLSLDPN